jgi:hypothetical protein
MAWSARPCCQARFFRFPTVFPLKGLFQKMVFQHRDHRGHRGRGHTPLGMTLAHRTHRCDIFPRNRPYRFTSIPTGSYRIVPQSAQPTWGWPGPAFAAEAAASAEYAWPCGRRNWHRTVLEAPPTPHTIRGVESPNATQVAKSPPLTVMTVSDGLLRFWPPAQQQAT